MAVLLTNDTELQTVANAIRTKGGTTGSLSYPTGFATAIGNIASDCTATAGDILSGKTAWVGNAKVTGSVSSKAAAIYNTSSSDQTIAAGQYIGGAQTIKAVTTSNLAAGNIKAGVTVNVGDSNDEDRIAGVTGTFTGDADATAGDLLSGKTAYVNGEKITGSLESQGAQTINTSTNDQTIVAGKYLSGTQTIKAVKTENLSAGNIKAGVTVKVGDANSAGRIASVAGTFTSDANATAGNILSGKTAYVNGSKVTGSIGSKGAATYNTSTSDQSISAGQYLSGIQTIKAVKTANISAANIKLGVNVTVGDASSAGRIVNVTGTCAPFVMPPSGIPPFMWCQSSTCIAFVYHQYSGNDRPGEKAAGYICSRNLTTHSDYCYFYVPVKLSISYCATRWNGPTTTTLSPGIKYTVVGTEEAGDPQMSWIPSSGSRFNVWKICSWTPIA